MTGEQRRRRASRSVDLTAEEPGPRAEIQTGNLSIAGRLFGGYLQFKLAGASSWALSYVVLTIGALLPPGLCLGICKAAGASGSVTLWVCLVAVAGSLGLAAFLQSAATRIGHGEGSRREPAGRARRGHGPPGGGKPAKRPGQTPAPRRRPKIH